MPANALVAKSVGIQSPKTLSDKDFEAAIKKFFTYTKLKPKVNFSALDKQFSGIYDIPTLVGTEIEVEKMDSSVVLPGFWNGKTDGSLRDGAEFYTIPLTPKQTIYASALIMSVMDDLANSKPDFSWRTAIHDHLNVLDLKEDELRVLLVLSMIFERLFFKFVGVSRTQSVFCVPLTEATVVGLLRNYIQGKESLKGMWEEWPKYTAINLSRMFTRGPEEGLGTIEFRHLPGTKDVDTVLMWHSLIFQLFRAAIDIKLDKLEEMVMNLNSSMKYKDLVYSVFDTKLADKLEIGNFEILFSGPISRAKELFAPKVKIAPIKATSALAVYALRVQAEKTKKKPKKKVTKSVTLPLTASEVLEQIANDFQAAQPIHPSEFDSIEEL